MLRLGEGNFNHAVWHAREKLRDCNFRDDDTVTEYEFEPGEEGELVFSSQPSTSPNDNTESCGKTAVDDPCPRG